MTSFISRDVTLKRQGHIRGRSCTPVRPSLDTSRPLNIIIEEDESRPSSPSSISSTPEANSNLSLKAKRRHATVVSDIRLSRVFPTDDCLLSSSPPAPQPPTTFNPLPSPDSFNLTFTDLSFEFPHPPIPTPTSLRKYECDSPTSSLSSSPASETEAMPLTPSSSDDEFSPPIMSRRRPVIQPLVITKLNPRPSSPFDDDCPISPSLLQPFKNDTESSAPLSPLSPSYLPEAFFDESDDASDSDPESDSEWYSRELSKIISLRSPIPPSFPNQTSTRPDSIFIPSSDVPAPVKRRVSKPLPPTPLSGGFPSAQLDPAFPHTKSRRSNIPKYPPPPIPIMSPSFLTPTSSSSPCSSSFSRRPPPRSSIPADCVYDLVDVEDMKQQDDDASAFSFSIYDVYLGDEPDSLPSAYSQEEDLIDGASFDLDCSMMLPLSLPTTPFDLEADIAQGLEQLRNSPVDGQSPDFIIPEIREPEPEPESEEQPPPQQQQQQQQQQQHQEVVDDIFSPTFTSDATSPTSPSYYPYMTTDEKILKSRWSTSTFGSVREEHESRGASSKLRLYFSPLKNQKQGSKKTSTTTTPSSPPPSPPSHKTPASPSPLHASSVRSPTRAHIRGHSDVMVIGYGNNGHRGIRRRGSVTNSVSDAGSEESCSSASSNGLRRKPIPVEMFLRSAV